MKTEVEEDLPPLDDCDFFFNLFLLLQQPFKPPDSAHRPRQCLTVVKFRDPVLEKSHHVLLHHSSLLPRLSVNKIFSRSFQSTQSWGDFHFFLLHFFSFTESGLEKEKMASGHSASFRCSSSTDTDTPSHSEILVIAG
jgi:hypothetical protein